MDDLTEAVSRRILLLLKLDSIKLMQKIVTREDQYLSILSIKRSRTHFDKIFKNSYSSASLDMLKNCDESIIEALHYFYSNIDDMEWYLGHTEDLPGAIKDRVDNFIKDLEKKHDALLSLINEKLGIENEMDESITHQEDEIEEQNEQFYPEENTFEEELTSEISPEVLKDLES